MLRFVLQAYSIGEILWIEKAKFIFIYIKFYFLVKTHLSCNQPVLNFQGLYYRPNAKQYRIGYSRVYLTNY